MKILAALLVVAIPCAGLWLALGLVLQPAWQGALLAASGRWQEAAQAYTLDPANAYNRGNALAHAGKYPEAVDAYQAALDLDGDDADAAFNKALVAGLLTGQEKAAQAVANGANSPAIQDKKGHALASDEGQNGGSGNGFAGSQEGVASPGARGGGKVSKVGKGGQQGGDSGDGAATGSAGSGSGAGRSGGIAADTAKAIAAAPLRVQRMMETRSILPTREWLLTLPDDPGKYLKARLLAEQARRRGLTSGDSDRDKDE